MRHTCRSLSVAPEAWLPDSWIIEEELRRERERQERDQPYLELPLQMPYEERSPEGDDATPQPRGVYIIDL